MRRDFDSKVSQGEALLRIPKIHTGHKHMHKNGPGRVAEDQRRKRRHVQAIQRAKRKKQLAATRAYWRGEADEHK